MTSWHTNMTTKFRVWDTRTNTLIAEGFHVIGEVVLFGLIEQYLYENKKPEETTLGLLQYVVVDEFTKAKDRGDKDLYSGDIVEIMQSGMARGLPKGSRFVITYDEVHNRWGTEYVGNLERRKQGYRMDSMFFITPANSKNLKKIGNKYQNPELLIHDETN